jgi:hypothetical protein
MPAVVISSDWTLLDGGAGHIESAHCVSDYVFSYLTRHLCCVLAEMLRENKRMLDKAIRELDRERIGLQNQEKKTIAEIKKMAKEGQMVCRAFGCCAWSTAEGGCVYMVRH